MKYFVEYLSSKEFEFAAQFSLQLFTHTLYGSDVIAFLFVRFVGVKVGVAHCRNKLALRVVWKRGFWDYLHINGPRPPTN